MRAPATSPARNGVLGSTTFIIYCIYTIDYYVRISARVHAIAATRPTLILFGVIVILLLAQQPRLQGRLNSRTSKALFALLAYLAVSLPFVTWPGSVLHSLDPFARVVAFFLFTALIVDTETKLLIFLAVFVGCQVFRVLDPLYLHITAGYLGDSTYIGDGDFAGRLSGGPYDVVNPNGLGFVTVTCIPFLYYCLYGSRQLYRKLLAIALIGSCLYVVYLTLSRGAMVALVVVAWMIFRGTKRKLLFVAGLAVVLMVAWAHLGGVHKDRYMSLLGVHGGAEGSVQATEDQTAYGRVKVTEEEFDIGMQRPIFGHGLGTTAEAKVHDGHPAQASHNLYTELLVEIGVVGALFFFRFLYSIYVELKEVQRALSDDEKRFPDDFYRRLIRCFVAIFWMYVVFSANYFGLSQDYWYALGGMVIALGRQVLPAAAPVPLSATNRSRLQRGVRRLPALRRRPKLGLH